MLRSLLALALTLGVLADLPAQVVAPPPPKTYDVIIRYRIRAGSNVRLVQYFKLLEFLEQLGFQKNPGPDDEPENPNYTRMTGRIDSAKATRLLDADAIKTILLMPSGYVLPAEEDSPVKVQLTLASNIQAEQRHNLHLQVLDHLRALGFVEAVGYDTRGYTRIVGRIPAGELDTLLDDLRSRPAGWLVPEVAVEALPSPLRGIPYPIRITEVIPEPKEAPPPAETKGPDEPAEAHLRKLTPDLKARMAEDGERPIRIEAILVATPGELNQSWPRELVAAAPQLVIDGRLGPIVSGIIPAAKAGDLAQSEIVATVRLPTSGAPVLRPGTDKDLNALALEASGLVRLHGLGHKGQGIRLGIIAGDFRGWEQFLGKGLAPTTRLLDVTIERNSAIEPEPYPDDGVKVGAGTRAALAAALAAPDANLLLIRVDPSSPYQLMEVMRRINGESARSFSREQRDADINVEREQLRTGWDAHFTERRILFQNFGGDDESIKLRQDHFQKTKDLEAQEKRFQDRIGRMLKLETELRDLSRLNVVVNTLVYHQGHQIDGGGPLSRYLDDRPFRNTIWVQAGGDIRGQTWTGPYQDRDQNGVLEFGADVRPGRWSNELNFLAWEPVNGKTELELPAQANLRVTLLWKEAHDPEFMRRGEDLYREPLAKPRLLLLRQRDPSGKLLASDDLDFITYSAGLPQRIDNQPESATYEQVMIYTVPAAGRYALRIEGYLPDGIRPPGAPVLPIMRRSFELRPRLLVEVTDTASRAAGRPLLLDYQTNEGSLGMPGDAQLSLTTAAADRSLQARAETSLGPPLGLELLPKPTILAIDGLDLGGDALRSSSLSAGFAGGQIAATLGAGAPFHKFWLFLPKQPGTLLRVPAGWPSDINPKR